LASAALGEKFFWLISAAAKQKTERKENRGVPKDTLQMSLLLLCMVALSTLLLSFFFLITCLKVSLSLDVRVFDFG
jgi:hypothetical protein